MTEQNKQQDNESGLLEERIKEQYKEMADSYFSPEFVHRHAGALNRIGDASGDKITSSYYGLRNLPLDKHEDTVVEITEAIGESAFYAYDYLPKSLLDTDANKLVEIAQRYKRDTGFIFEKYGENVIGIEEKYRHIFMPIAKKNIKFNWSIYQQLTEQNLLQWGDKVLPIIGKYQTAADRVFSWFDSEIFDFEEHYGDITDKAKTRCGITHIHRYVRRIECNQKCSWNPELLEEIINNNDMRRKIEKPVALAIVNKNDYNNGFRNLYYPLDSLRKGHTLIVMETGNKYKALENIKRIGRKRKIDFLMFCGHGNQDQLHLGDSLLDNGKIREDIEMYEHAYLNIHDAEYFTEIGNYLSKGAVFVLNGCRIGAGGSEAINLTTTAKKKIPHAMLVGPKVALNEGIHRFEFDNKNEQIYFRVNSNDKEPLLILP